jgi:AraC family transcriptional regulator
MNLKKVQVSPEGPATVEYGECGKPDFQRGRLGWAEANVFDSSSPHSPERDGCRNVRISRWFADKAISTHTLVTSAGEHAMSLCLRATRTEFRSKAGTSFNGVMRAGALHVLGPEQAVTAQMSGACDILHLHIPTAVLEGRLRGMGVRAAAVENLSGCTLSDPLVEQLAKLLLTEAAGSDAIYATAIAQTLVTRILHLAQNRSPAGALAKWRLRRVQALVDASLAEPLTLSDLAAAAGLSRMHFAAQFRAATGSSPHEYLLCRRIEAAKALLVGSNKSLAEIALDVGFMAQAHFTTVFKRLVGSTPARWRRARQDAGSPQPNTRRHAATQQPNDDAVL